MLTGHFDAVGRVGVNHHLKAVKSLTDGLQAVGVRAFTAGKAVAGGRFYKSGMRTQIKIALRAELPPEQI